MQKLQDHRAAHSALSDAAYATKLGISRPFLVDLLAGRRHPSLTKAQGIEKATGGAVPARDWPNVAKLLDAAASIERGAA